MTTSRKTRQPKDLSQTPKRRGDVYCSPRCGYGCTWLAYQQAKSAAAKLCNSLGRGWRPRVWENLGWHYEALREGVEVYGEGPAGPFMVILAHQYVGHGRTPRKAIREAYEAALPAFEALTLALQHARDALNPSGGQHP